MTTNLEYYKVFYYVATYKSLTVAAGKLNVSQPAVSQAIRQLENSLGVKLFKRASRGVEMTREAAVLYEYVKRAINEFEAGESKLREVLNLNEGEVRIGASDMTLRFFLLPYLERFHELFPKIKISVTNAPTPETVENLRNHSVDFGVASTPFTFPEFVNVLPVRKIEDTFVAGRRYLRLKNRTLDIQELEKLPIVALEKNTTSRRFMDDFLKDRGVTIKPEFELATSDMIVEFTVKNLGIGCVMKDFATEKIEDGTLFELRFRDLLPKRDIAVLTDNRNALSPASRALLELIEEDIND